MPAGPVENQQKGRLGGGGGGLEPAQGLELLVAGLEASVAELGGGIDELEGDGLQRLARGLGEDRLPQRDRTLLGSGDGSLHTKTTATFRI